MTKKIFNSDPYLKKFEATVTACTENKGKFDLTLDQTAFFPTGGGQPHDDGEIDGAVVFDVYEKDGEIYHTVARPIEVGKKVVCEIDFEKRFMLMQNHSGEHIVSGIINKKYGFIPFSEKNAKIMTCAIWCNLLITVGVSAILCFVA